MRTKRKEPPEEDLISLLGDLELGNVDWHVPKPQAQWAEGDAPWCESMDLQEYPSVLKGITKCRSFAADLNHKLQILVKACGGWGNGGVRRACQALRIDRSQFANWRYGKTSPCRLTLQRIDNRYSEALEILAAQLVAKRRKRT